MLKHMLNGNASGVGAERGANAVSLSSCASPSTGGCHTLPSTAQQLQHHQCSTSQPQPSQLMAPVRSPTSSPLPLPPLQRRQRSSESVDNDRGLERARGASAAVSEPEYQNTRRRSSPPPLISECGRGMPSLTKSVRSLENVPVAAAAVVCEPESGARRPALDPQWMATSIRHSRLNGHGSLPNHPPSYAGYVAHNVVASPPNHHQHHHLQQQQQYYSLSSPLHRPNHSSDASIAPVCPGFAPIASSPTKPMANGGLHLPKQSPTTVWATPTNSAAAAAATATATAAKHYATGTGAAVTDSSTDVSKENNRYGDDEEVGGGVENVGPDRGGEIEPGCDHGGSGSSRHHRPLGDGIGEVLTSLGLLCLVSLLLALLSLIFLLKISPVTAADVKDLMRVEQFAIISPDEYVTVYEVTLALCSLTLSLNLCCLLVCSVQFLFAVKLTGSSLNGDGTNKYLQKSAITRVCAIAGFFISIPIFLTGVILYTFIQFHSTSAIITSVLVGSGIVFCGCAMVHNVFVWQKEKTNAVKAMMVRQRRRVRRRTAAEAEAEAKTAGHATGNDEPADAAYGARSTDTRALGGPAFTLGQRAAVDFGSVTSALHELSTLV